MALFQSKPTTIEAVQWTGINGPEMTAFAPDKVRASEPESVDPLLTLLAGKDGAQEWVPVPVGHWLVNQPGDKSDIWPVDPAYFAAKYEPSGQEGDAVGVGPCTCGPSDACSAQHCRSSVGEGD